MNTCTLNLYRPWHQRLIDALAESLGRARRGAAAGDDLCRLHHHLLADIGLHPGLTEPFAAEERQRTAVVRLHSIGGF